VAIRALQDWKLQPSKITDDIETVIMFI